MAGYAWVTLATNDAYSLGALVLAHSLRRVETKYELAILITPGVTQIMREKLSAAFSLVMEVNVLDSKDEANLALLARPELGVTFTKLHCWRLTQYEKCVFLDADTLVVRNCDELFEREELSAAPDVGWPDCFNSGVFVYKPSQQTFASITAFAAAKGSFDGGDQGLLNMYFSDWATKDISKHLPFIYNMCSTAAYSYLPAFKEFGDDVRIIHFIGITKPWLQYFDTLTGIVQPPMGSAHLQPLLQLWWNIFCEKVHPQLSPVMATSTLAPIWHKFSPMPFEPSTPIPSNYRDVQDRLQNDVYEGPVDFSEFRDPWEHYNVRDDPMIYKPEGNNDVEHQRHSLYDNLSSVHHTHHISSLENNRNISHEHSHESYQNYHEQGPFNERIHESKHQPSYSTSGNVARSENQSDHWQRRYSIENKISIDNDQSYHSDESQHHCVDHQHIPPPNFFHDNEEHYEEMISEYGHKGSSEVTQHQHNDVYVDPMFNNYKVFDNINNNETSHNCEKEKRTFHSSSESYFVYHETEEKHKHLETNVAYDKAIRNSIAYHEHNLSIKRNTELDKNLNVTDLRTIVPDSTSPQPVSTPCTDIHNVAQQSDPPIRDDLNSSNAGLAGALAQMTLGEPRSAEQIALEEHMRKQSWEQGQIDYMGRDCFDNIWKKICETLALAPPRLPSPPKETKAVERSETDKTEEPVETSEATQPVKSVDEVDNRTVQATISHAEEQCLVKDVPTTNVPKLLEKSAEIIDDAMSVIKKCEESLTAASREIIDNSVKSLPDNVSTSKSEIVQVSSTFLEDPQRGKEATAPEQLLGSNESRVIEKQGVNILTHEDKEDVDTVESAADIRERKEGTGESCTKELSNISESLPDNPVPIQVAESVLQMDSKESVKPQSQVTSMSPEVFSMTESTERKNREPTNAATLTDIDDLTKVKDSSAKTIEPTEIVTTAEEIRQPIATTETSQTIAEPKEKMAKTLTESDESNKGGSLSGKAPLRPSRTKESPSTAGSTNNSKTVQQEKTTKKTGKKLTEKLEEAGGGSTETTDTGDAGGKKVTKKVVKKVVKKPKTKLEEEQQQDNGTEERSQGVKQKKTTKVVKKNMKPSQTSVTDPSSPEAPSCSTTFDPPVPPKRKTKSATTKAASKKSDTEE